MSTDTESARIHCLAGLAALEHDRLAEALERFERARQLDRANGEYHFFAGAANWKLGNGDAAWKCCQAALACKPDFARAHVLMSEIALPGPAYLEVLRRIHAYLRPRTYLEIGVFQGASLSLAHPETHVIGVDPSPRIGNSGILRPRIVSLTSDEYFAKHDVRADLGGSLIALAFIDGMHHFEFALRDLIHIEKHCAPQATVLIHDCYPLDRTTAERESRTEFWSGDIWRLVLLLKKYRPKLSVNVIATAPTGLGVVRRLDPDSALLETNYEAIVGEFLALDYSVLEADKAGMLALYPNDWEKIKAILQ